VDVAVCSALEVGLLAEDKVEEVVVEFVIEIDEDWAWYQRRPSEAEIISSGDHEGKISEWKEGRVGGGNMGRERRRRWGS
jgi:hypothetical protein